MNKFAPPAALLVCVSLVLVAAAACAPTATPVPPSGAAGDSIQGILWQWTRVTNKDTGDVTTVPDPEAYTLILNADGTLTGNADCNAFTGTYTQDNDFTITLDASTMAFCGEDSLDQQYLDLLGTVAAGGPDGTGGLALETPGGQQRMEFANGGTASAQ